MSNNAKIDLTCYTSHSDSLAFMSRDPVSYIKLSPSLLQENYQPYAKFSFS